MSYFIPEVEDFLSAEDSVSASHHIGSMYHNVNSLQEAALCSSLHVGGESLLNNAVATHVTQNNPRHYEEWVNANEYLVPSNLFQASCDLRLNTLASHDRSMLEDLINKIKYQINFFHLDDKSQANKIKLTCTVCCVTLNIAKVEKHVFKQKHLRNLTERCKNFNETSASTVISQNKLDFLDFDESVQCYQCTLCKVNFSDVKNSWNKHFQSVSHHSKLEALKSNSPSNPSDTISLTPSSESTSIAGNYSKNSNEKTDHENTNIIDTSCSQRQISEDIQNNCSIPLKTTLNRALILNSSTRIRSQTSTIYNPFIQADQEINEDFENDPNFDLLHSVHSKKASFRCKLCNVTIKSPKMAKHVRVMLHLKNLTLNSYFENFQSLEESCKKIVRKTFDETGSKLIYYFFLLPDTCNGKPQFKCKVCNVILCSSSVGYHMETEEHQNYEKQNKSDFCFGANLSTSSQLHESVSNLTNGPALLESVDEITRVSASVGRSSSPALSNFCVNTHSLNFKSCRDSSEEVTKNYENKLPSSDFNNGTSSNQTGFIHQDCDNVIPYNGVKNNGLHKETSKCYFINCCGKSTETTLSNSKNFKISENNDADCKTTLLSIHNAPNRIYSPCNSTTVSRDPESGVDVRNHSNEDILLNFSPISASDKIHSSSAFGSLNKSTHNLNFQSVGDSPERVSGELKIRTLVSKFNNLTTSSGTSFTCQDCSAFIPLTTLENNGLRKGTIKWLFINCQRKSLERALSNPKNRKVSKNNTLDNETSSPTIGACKINSLQLDNDFKGVLNNSNKEILKMLIDEVGIKISHFDFVLENISGEIRFKCKFCNVLLRPKTVGTHVNYKEHVKNLQLSDISSIRFESLDDHSKKLIRKLYNKVGSEINNIDIVLRFVCKICGAHLSSETAANHFKSEEHLKQLLGHSSRDGSITNVCTTKNSENCSKDLVNTYEKAHINSSPRIAHHFASSESFQSVNDFKSAKIPNGVFEKSAGDFAEILGDNNPISTTVPSKPQIDFSVSATVLSPMSTKNVYHPRKAEGNTHVSRSDKLIVGKNETSHVSGSPSGKNNSIPSAESHDQSHIHIFSTHESAFPPKSPSAQNSGVLESENCLNSEISASVEIENKSKLVPGLVISSSSQLLSCVVCHDHISSKDIRSHVNSEDHAVYSKKPWYDSEEFFHHYYNKIAQMFIGYISHDKNILEVFYEVPEKKLHFYCKDCHLMVHAEALENHMNHAAHLSNLPEKLLLKQMNYELASDTFATGRGNRDFKNFFCEPCNRFVHLEHVANHVNTASHLKASFNTGSFLQFTSFISFRDRVVETLAPSKSKKKSDFEFFFEVNSPKLYIYCKPCEILIKPENFDPHVGLGQHGLNSSIMQQWDRSYGPYHRAFYTSQEEILQQSSGNTLINWCPII